MLWLPLLSAPASSQAVTFAELDGALVEALVVHQQVLRREGREFPARLESDLTLLVPETKFSGHGRAQSTRRAGKSRASHKRT